MARELIPRPITEAKSGRLMPFNTRSRQNTLAVRAVQDDGVVTAAAMNEVGRLAATGIDNHAFLAAYAAMRAGGDPLLYDDFQGYINMAKIGGFQLISGFAHRYAR